MHTRFRYLTAMQKVFAIAMVGTSLSMLTGCGNDSGDDNDNDAADFTGTWMLNEVSEESLGTMDNNVLNDGALKFQKISRQLVTIKQQNDGTAQVQFCGEDMVVGNVSAAALTFDVNTYRPTISNVTDLTPIVASLVLTGDADGELHGTLETVPVLVPSEPAQNFYQVKRDITLVRVSPDVNAGGIGSLALDWSFRVAADFTSTERRDEAVNCFVETVRTKSAGEAGYLYGIDDAPTKKLMLDAETVQVTFADSLHYQGGVSDGSGDATDRSAFVERSVALKLKPVVSEIGFGQRLYDLSAEEESAFSTPTPLLRQQYTSTASSLAGAVNVDVDSQFMHAQFDLKW